MASAFDLSLILLYLEFRCYWSNPRFSQMCNRIRNKESPGFIHSQGLKVINYNLESTFLTIKFTNITILTKCVQPCLNQGYYY
jgi:hypothetical protein